MELLKNQFWSTYNKILQYLQGSDTNDENNKNYTNYLYRGPCSRYGKMTYKENLEMS